MTPAMERIINARSKACMQRKTAFYGVCAMSLHYVETRRVDTAATDGTNLFFNPDYVMGLTDAQVLFLVAHEVRHCTDGHFSRRGWRDNSKWNVATDLRINHDLVHGAIGEMIDGGLYDPQYGPDMAAEDIYAARDVQQPDQPEPEQPDQPQESGPEGDDEGQGGSGNDADDTEADEGNDEGEGEGDDEGDTEDGTGDEAGDDEGEADGDNPKVGDDGDNYPQLDNYSDPGKCGGVIDAAGDEAETAAEQRKWEAISREAVSIATKMNDGVVPSDLKNLATQLEKSTTDWREVLRAIVDPASQQNYTWTQPDRRFAGQPFVLPGLIKEGVNHVVIGFDTSGSMADPRAQGRLQAEAQALMDEGIVDKFTVIYCDDYVHRVDTFEQGDPLVFNPVGGGGTSFVPVFDWLDKNGWDASAIVYFTDMMGRFPTYGPDIPTLWAAYGDPRHHSAPFGEVVQLDR